MAIVINSLAASGILKGVPSGKNYFLVAFVYVLDTETKKIDTRLKCYDSNGKFYELKESDVEVIH